MIEPRNKELRYQHEAIVKAMDEKGITCRDLANALGITERTLVRVRAGEQVSRGTLALVAHGLGLEFERIVEAA